MPTSTGSKRSRKQTATTACDFCRRRKLRCDTGNPCNKCAQYGRDCVYTERPVRQRPTNSRISALVQQNEELRASLSLLKAAPTPDSSVNGAHAQDDSRLERAASSPESRDDHRPSSVLLDKLGYSFSDQHSAASSTDHEKNYLLAKASTQRQLEGINLEAGLFAFGDSNDVESSMSLLTAFWNRQHCMGTVVYRPVFMRDLVCQGPHFSPLLLNAMLFVACKHSSSFSSSPETPRLCTGGMRFRRRFEQLLYDEGARMLCKSAVTTIQALLLMSHALFSWCDEKSLSWHYLGIAINMIFDLGIHANRSAFYRSGSIESRELGRRVFWAAFMADKMQAIYQGRPCRLRLADSSISILFLDEYEEMEPFNTITFNARPTQTRIASRAVTTFEQTCKLCIVAESILSALYTEHDSHDSLNDLSLIVSKLDMELQHWKDSLPPHLRLSKNGDSSSKKLPHTLSLMAMYHSLFILLHRPFVAGRHTSKSTGSSASFAFLACVNAASEIDFILRLYVQQFCVKSCPYYLSYATYASATIHARVASQQDSGSTAHNSLRFCLEVLSAQQELCHAPRRSMAVLLELMRRLDVDVGRKYTAARSRTEDIEECQADALARDTQQSNVSDHGQDWLADIAGTGEDTQAAYDLDAIMKTFDLTPHGLLLAGGNTYSSEGNDFLSQIHILGQGSVEATRETCDPIGEGVFPGVYPRSASLDPLFGLDAPMFDTNTDFIV